MESNSKTSGELEWMDYSKPVSNCMPSTPPPPPKIYIDIFQVHSMREIRGINH